MKIREYFDAGVGLIKQYPETILLSNLIGMAASAASLGLLTGPYLCGVFHVCLEARRGRRPEIRDALAPLGRITDSLIAGALFALAFALGLSLFWVAAAPVAALLIWTFPILVDRRLPWPQAIQQSLAFARRDYRGTLLIVTLAYLLGWGGLLPAGLGWLLWTHHHPFLAVAFGGLGLALTALLLPITHAILAVAYEDMTSESPESLVDASWIR